GVGALRVEADLTFLGDLLREARRLPIHARARRAVDARLRAAFVARGADGGARRARSALCAARRLAAPALTLEVLAARGSVCQIAVAGVAVELTRRSCVELVGARLDRARRLRRAWCVDLVLAECEELRANVTDVRWRSDREPALLAERR